MIKKFPTERIRRTSTQPSEEGTGDHAGEVIQLHPRRDRVIAITGGKGGVGKSSIAVNLAIAYAERGAQTLAVDADFGMADLNLLLGVAPAKSLLDVINGTSVDEVLVDAHGIALLPALNGSYCLETMSDARRRIAFEAIDSLQRRFDTLIIDVAAGIGPNQTEITGAAADVVVVVTPEALSLADAYACLKVLSQRQGIKQAYVLPNRVRTEAEGEEVIARLQSLVSRFLDMKLISLPHIPQDYRLAAAGATGVPMMKANPDCPAARAIRKLSRKLDAIAAPDVRSDATQSFWKGLLAHQG